MKRSEMVNKIHDKLVDMELNFGSLPFKEITLDQADQFLTMIEESGMLPPCYLNPEYDEAVDPWRENKFFRDWEKEDVE